jgi:hypothetical protein
MAKTNRGHNQADQPRAKWRDQITHGNCAALTAVAFHPP